jgi:hypothetical protein
MSAKPKSTHPFRRLKPLGDDGRIIGKWGGVLPACAGTRYDRAIMHTLICMHLRNIIGERYSPYKARPYLTHEIFLFYRVEQEDVSHLVFRMAYDFSVIKSLVPYEDLTQKALPSKLIDPDRIALRCCSVLVKVLTSVEEIQPLIQYDKRWAKIIEDTHNRIKIRALTYY